LLHFSEAQKKETKDGGGHVKGGNTGDPDKTA